MSDVLRFEGVHYGLAAWCCWAVLSLVSHEPAQGVKSTNRPGLSLSHSALEMSGGVPYARDEGLERRLMAVFRT